MLIGMICYMYKHILCNYLTIYSENVMCHSFLPKIVYAILLCSGEQAVSNFESKQHATAKSLSVNAIYTAPQALFTKYLRAHRLSLPLLIFVG